MPNSANTPRRTLLLTGASRGIGRSIALELAKEGCDVVAAARDASTLESLAVEIRTGLGRRVRISGCYWRGWRKDHCEENGPN